MQQIYIRLQSHGKPSARKLGGAGSVSVCDVNNDTVLHWLRFNMRSASLNNKPNGLQIQAPIIYLMDHWRPTFQTRVGITNAWTAYRKNTLRLMALWEDTQVALGAVGGNDGLQLSTVKMTLQEHYYDQYLSCWINSPQTLLHHTMKKKERKTENTCRILFPQYNRECSEMSSRDTWECGQGWH